MFLRTSLRPIVPTPLSAVAESGACTFSPVRQRAVAVAIAVDLASPQLHEPYEPQLVRGEPHPTPLEPVRSLR